MDQRKLAKFIDHTILKPDATTEMIQQVIKEARELEVASVCLNPWAIPTAVAALQSSPVKVCTVVGFPLGAMQAEAKAQEAALAVQAGAQEIDMVINVGALKSGLHQIVSADIAVVVEAVRVVNAEAIVKVIIETSLLTQEEKVVACQLAKEAGAHFVKTSTGFNGGGATVEDIRLMRQTVGETFGVKASGGIRDLQTALAMIEAGASRIGTSSGPAILAACEVSFDRF